MATVLPYGSEITIQLVREGRVRVPGWNYIAYISDARFELPIDGTFQYLSVLVNDARAPQNLAMLILTPKGISICMPFNAGVGTIWRATLIDPACCTLKPVKNSHVHSHGETLTLCDDSNFTLDGCSVVGATINITAPLVTFRNTAFYNCKLSAVNSAVIFEHCTFSGDFIVDECDIYLEGSRGFWGSGLAIMWADKTGFTQIVRSRVFGAKSGLTLNGERSHCFRVEFHVCTLTIAQAYLEGCMIDVHMLRAQGNPANPEKVSTLVNCDVYQREIEGADTLLYVIDVPTMMPHMPIPEPCPAAPESTEQRAPVAPETAVVPAKSKRRGRRGGRKRRLARSFNLPVGA